MSISGTHTEHWLTVYKWLRLCGNNINRHFCRENITTHPDYPALLSTIDFLDSGGMSYHAVQAGSSNISEFHYPLLAHIKIPILIEAKQLGEEYMQIISQPSEWQEQKEITQYWTGVTVFPGRDKTWRNEDNNLYTRNAARTKIDVAIWILTAFGFLVYSLIEYSNSLIKFFGVFSFFGLILSLLALGSELGFQNQIVKQVCGAFSNGGCERVLKSKFAKGVAGITPADASFLYFVSQFLMYILGCWQPNLLSGIFKLALLGIIVIAWSFYTQWIKLMQWCALCVGVDIVLLVQQGIAVSPLPPIINNNKQSIFWFILLLCICIFIYLPIKKLLQTNIKNKTKLVELRKWKLDGELFLSQWAQEQEVNTDVWENEIILGNEKAPLTITVACNPYCRPCAKAHVVLDEMLIRFKKELKILIRFFTPPKIGDDQISRATAAIIQRAKGVKNSEEARLMLAEWFEWMEFEKWSAKWKPDHSIDVNPDLERHSSWMETSAIIFTPTFFLNGKKVPGRYDLNDLIFLIPQLAMSLKAEISVST